MARAPLDSSKHAHDLAVALYDFTHIIQDYITSTGAIIWLRWCQWLSIEGCVEIYGIYLVFAILYI